MKALPLAMSNRLRKEQKHERSCNDLMGSDGFTYKKNEDRNLWRVGKRRPWSWLQLIGSDKEGEVHI